MGKKKVLVVYGTRPEAIKMAPLVQALTLSSELEPVLCATAQHRGLLDQVNDFFGMVPDYDLDLMKPDQDLFHVTENCLRGVKRVLTDSRPAAVLVQGDTTTTFASALAAFYLKVPVGHVEAGLRTGNLYSPFPEEANRRMVTPLAAYHFAPTEDARENLLEEDVDEDKVFLTGNTSIDALLWTAKKNQVSDHLRDLAEGKNIVLLTSHRRENFGAPLQRILETVRDFALEHPLLHFVYPVHPNPNVQGPAESILGRISNISLIPPVSYPDLVYLLRQSLFVLTDSGGIQEEAPTLGKPVLVLRESTERPEAITAGCARLVGHDPRLIWQWMKELSNAEGEIYLSMAKAQNPFGSGDAAETIVRVLEGALREQSRFANIRAYPKPHLSGGYPALVN